MRPAAPAGGVQQAGDQREGGRGRGGGAVVKAAYIPGGSQDIQDGRAAKLLSFNFFNILEFQLGKYLKRNSQGGHCSK